MITTNSQPRQGTWYRRTLVTIMADDGTLIDAFEVPKFWGTKYCVDHPTGYYGQRYQAAIAKCKKYEADAIHSIGQ